MVGEINIRVISVWFGKLPSYFPYFLKTCEANVHIDWMLISDQEFLHKPSENITTITISKSAFTSLVSKQLGFDVTFNDPYKVCDFKPVFGKIFEDQLKAYQYWGYCDLDMVFGDIRKHINHLLLEKPDIISFYLNFLSGPFCLYHNKSSINELFMSCPGFRSILQDPEHKAFDENIPRKIAGIRKVICLISYLLNLIFIGPRHRFNIPEIRYQFQWYCKKLNSKKTYPLDMTEAVLKAYNSKQIMVIFKDLIRSDRAYWRKGLTSWKLFWQDGKLINTKNGEDVLTYHFIDSKYKPDFLLSLNAQKMNKIIISEKKIECIE